MFGTKCTNINKIVICYYASCENITKFNKIGGIIVIQITSFRLCTSLSK